MCKLFKVSRSCYYNWIEKGCIVNRVDVEFNNLIKNIFEQSRATYGTRRLKRFPKNKDMDLLFQEEKSKIFKTIESKSKNETKI